MEHAKGFVWGGSVRVYPSVHFFHRQAAREKLAARKALTEAARERHLALALDYEKRAEAMRSASA
jgi:hypothetical protein